MIKFGMKVPEIFAQLVKGYRKVTGRNPEGLDLIRIRQESLRRFQDMNKVVDMQTGKSIDINKPIVGGTQEIKEVQKRIESGVATTIEKMLAMDPVDAMKEANRVISRKGPYKNLSEQDAKKILQDTEDHIFERNIKPKETDMDFDEDFAIGGRVGYASGSRRSKYDSTGGGLASSSKSMNISPGPGGGGGGGDGPKGPPIKDIKQKPPKKIIPEDSTNRGFLSDLRAKNRKRYLEILKKYKPDDFRAENIIDGVSNLTEEEADFIEPYGGGQIFRDLSEQNIENFMDIRGGVAPKIDKLDIDSPRQYDFAELNPLGLTQMRNLEKKKGMAPLDPNINFTEEDQKMLEELQRRDADPNEMYGPILKAANGGRIGLKKGSMDRRTFMKIIGGLTTLPVFGKFFKGAEVAAPVVEKAAEVASGAPPYFFNLVERIRALGKKFDGPKERTETYKYKDYEMQVDNDTGQIEITKQKLGYDERVGEGVVSEEYMSLKPGRADETTGGKKVADEYEENTGYTDKDGKLKDVESGVSEETVMDGSISKEELEQEIIEQLSKEAPSIKKASGGIARMLGE